MDNFLKLALRTDFVAFCKKAFAELHAGELPEKQFISKSFASFSNNYMPAIFAAPLLTSRPGISRLFCAPSA